ncbi:hypothetical protein VMT65_27425 [Nocardia sp. CDC153]|uniref:hypothetical protein n=1 Tax=Nocardia sp. CDC153 TaxID=3112167 RepID=UPI002DC00126|nr:hypothetical protein [Nocardia sp. CDC153]MEC3956796.1 hypothetical protein [Nocardia sp. CDC153]
MALEFTPWTIRSDKTPEMAVRTTLSMDSWVVTWLPNRMLSLELARIAMELDEVLSDPAPADAEEALEMAGLMAERLGLTPREVVVLLWDRYAEPRFEILGGDLNDNRCRRPMSTLRLDR